MTRFIAQSAVVMSLALVALTAPRGARAEDSCDAARRRIQSIPALWATNGHCADLSDESKAAVRATNPSTSLANFRAIKARWMNHWDKGTAGTDGAELEEIRAAAEDFISHHADRGPLNARLRTAVQRIARLNAAVDAMRPGGATTPQAVSAIDHALGDLQDRCAQNRDHAIGIYCPGEGTGILEVLDQELQGDSTAASDTALAALRDKIHAVDLEGAVNGLDQMHSILYCRLNDEQLARDRVAVHTPPCNGDVSQATASAPWSTSGLRMMCSIFPTNPSCLTAGSGMSGTALYGSALGFRLNPPPGCDDGHCYGAPALNTSGGADASH